MTQVSRFPLSKALKEEMNLLFLRSFAMLRSETDVQDLLEDLLTPNERIMLGKRLAIAYLLDKGLNQRDVHTIMKVSVSTVSGVNYWLTHRGTGYKNVLRLLKRNEEWRDFLEKLDKTLYETFSVKALYRRAYGHMPNPDHS
ncbi:MAG: Trp family transcriptional regulator [Patescibacteria group bacterium]